MAATARAIAFVALQCFRCSTMQVKQQKRSSNKWTCVVCNEKQSVIKVFARSHMAKDVRSFVQSFNMSRGFPENSQVPAVETPPPLSVDGEGSGGGVLRKAKRMDWNAYLDAGGDEDGARGCGTGLVDEREAMMMIVTELPDGSSKYKSGNPEGSSNVNVYKPRFSSRSDAKRSVVPSVQRSKKVCPDKSLQSSSGKRYPPGTEDDAETRKVKMTGTGRGSRWSSYMTEEEEFQDGEGRGPSRSNLLNETGRFCGDLQETAARDQAVEDDVHPDFI